MHITGVDCSRFSWLLLTSAAVPVCVVGRCAALRLHDVVAGDLFADDARLLRFRRSSDADGRVPEMTDTLNATERLYRVVLRTRPGGALYEATVRQPLSAEQLAGSEFDVDPRQISRTDQYGRQPHCIVDTYPHLRPYCYCIVRPSTAPANTSATNQ